MTLDNGAVGSVSGFLNILHFQVWNIFNLLVSRALKLTLTVH